MPAFWDTLPPPHDFPYLWFISDPKSKQDKVKNTNFKKLAKIEILEETLHATHLQKLLDKMYKYEMDPTTTVGATERRQDVGRTDGWTVWNQYIPPPPPHPTTWLCRRYDKHDYLDCFKVRNVLRLPSSAHTYKPKLLHSLNCFTVSTL